MKTCPKCHSSAYHIHDFLSGGGSTENRQSGEKSDNKDSAWRCIICGFYMPVLANTMPFPETILHKNFPTKAEMPKIGYHEKALSKKLTFFVNVNIERISAMKAKKQTYQTIAEKLSKEFGAVISGSALQKRCQGRV